MECIYHTDTNGGHVVVKIQGGKKHARHIQQGQNRHIQLYCKQRSGLLLTAGQ